MNDNLIHNLDAKVMTYASVFIIVLLGVGSGYLLSSRTNSSSNPSSKNSSSSKIVKSDKMEGSTDKSTFSDDAQGTLREGGVDGEGTHHLEREGGKSQNVYLTSSMIDLDKYVGEKVHVWGETFSAQKAGWLMDVGLVEVKD